MESIRSSDDSIQIVIRVRPSASDHGHKSCLNVNSVNTLEVKTRPTAKQFNFDFVADEKSSQKTVFNHVGQKIVEDCIEGYNGTIFAYGQTGAGKTYTMIGPSQDASSIDPDLYGIIPRSLNYLFQTINQKKDKYGSDMEFLCKCSFLEIYNEQVYDLLEHSSASPLVMRESIKHGVFVDRLNEKTVSNAAEALKVLDQGWTNRHVAETSMNRTSSRSHAVFTIVVESKDRTGPVVKMRKSVLNLVDLAGSEKQKDTNTSGLRLKEAGNINKSLSVLGNVIQALVDIADGKNRYVHYRDSKLTFLLRDSLGGNAKTFIIANIHPGQELIAETLSTLQFAQRAKKIVNKARINEDSEADVATLKKEVDRLNRLLRSMKSIESSSSAIPLPITPRKTPMKQNMHENSTENYEKLFFDAMDL